VCYESELRVSSSEFGVKRFNPEPGTSRSKRILMMGFTVAILLIPYPAQAVDRLYYFFSFSMPEESIQAAFSDGEKIGLVAVLRGLPEGSPKESLMRLQELLGERKIEVVIDPLLFRLYGITAIPTLVYAEGVNPSCEHCEPAPRHWKGVGDIPLAAGLENLARSAPSVDRYIKKLREGFFTK